MGRKQEEQRIVAEFSAWFRANGGHVLPVSGVGDRLIRRAQAEAVRLLPLNKDGLHVSVGNFHKSIWRKGIPDFIGEKDGRIWIAEVKADFKIHPAAESLGQLLLYGKLYTEDHQMPDQCELAAVFGTVEMGRVAGGKFTQGELVLDGVSSFFRRDYSIRTYLRSGPEQFREFPLPI